MGCDPSLVAAAAVLALWHRNPGIQVTETEFKSALEGAEKLGVA